MIDLTTAIYQLYPQVTHTRGAVAYDIDDNVVDYDLQAVTLQAQKNECKAKATRLLYDSDWTTIPDVADPTNNPYLTNQAEFIAYRNTIRGLAVNPVTDPVFPAAPSPVWSA